MFSPPHDLKTLYDTHAAGLYAFALNLSRSEADARDIMQETFCRVARQKGELREPKAFLFQVAYRIFLDQRRRQAVREENTPEPERLFQAAEDPDEGSFREALGSALGELPAEQRAVVHLKLWGGLTFEEIAKALELSPNTAASRYRYGIDKLRTLLRPIYDEIR